MSLRLIRRNRQIGTQLEDGRIVWQMMGAEGEEKPEVESDDSEEDSEDDEDDESESKTTLSQEEYEKLRKRMKAADRRATAAEQALKEKQQAELGDLEKAQSRVSELEAVNEELNSKLQQLQRERSFLGSNSVTWHDPEIAMSKLDWSSIIDEDGDTDHGALEKAIKDLAKSKPFLVKSETTSGEENKPGENGGQPSGHKVGNGKKQSKESMDREALLRKYPALR